MDTLLGKLGYRINNIGKIVDTNPDNDPKEDEKPEDRNLIDIGNIFDKDETAASDKNLKDVETTSTEDAIERAYKGLDSIIYRYNKKGQELGQDDKLRAGVTAQSLQGSILESNVFEDPESGFLKVDTAQQTLANAAAIKILFEKIDELEKLIKK